tara:strand:- start:13 stop:654 length:642 start_codon:yes stop_codon:yes gene_type:complete
MKIISPSLLSANFINLSKDIKILEDMGIKRLHLDIMDGHFVPALTFGPLIIDFIRKETNMHLEAHLMINNPKKSLSQYIKAGSDTIIIHLESSDNIKDDLLFIKKHNVLAGLAINPETSENELIPYLDIIDYILIMSVNPGKGGQSFIRKTLNKMKNIVKLRKDRNIIIGVDGGVNIETISEVYNTGIDVTIIGSGLFGANDIRNRYNKLLNA